MEISAEAADIVKQVTLMRDNEEWVRDFLAKASPSSIVEAMIVFAKMNKRNIGDVEYRSR